MILQPGESVSAQMTIKVEATPMSPWQSAVKQADQLGESPFRHPDEQMLYWVDIPGRQLRRANANVGTVESWAMPQEPGCIAPARSGGLVVALRDGIYRARQWGGALDLVLRFDHDTATTRFNDGKADALGRLWAGTMYEPRDQAKAQLFSIDCRPYNGQGGKPLVRRKAGDATIANGLAGNAPPSARLSTTPSAVRKPQAGSLESEKLTNRMMSLWCRPTRP
jgi:sugar lactone lactonase YvrE